MPVRHVSGNVVWTRHGTVWALWRVESEGQAHASPTARTRRLKALESLVKRLHGESMWLSLCPQVDPYAVVRQMTEGLVLSERYEALGHRVLDTLECLELTSRTDWLAVPLPARGWKEQAREIAAAARGEMAVQLGLMSAPVGREQERRRLAQAEALAATWPASVQVRPATEAEILWVYGHSARRGVLEPLLPEPEAARGVRGRGRGVAALEQAVLCEGGTAHLSDDAGSDSPGEYDADESAGQALLKRRWLEVATPWGASYQALLALSEMPDSFTFPGSEYLARLDDFSFPVDWVMRLQVTPGSTAEAKTRHKAREVATQPEEYASDPTGAPGKVLEAAPMMGEYRDRLTSSANEVEVRAMGALCVWGGTPGEADARAAELADWFGENEYALGRPVGQQEALWYGMLPGARTPSVMLQYSQYLLARDFCMAGPFSAAALGDERGPLFGFQLSGGGLRPVLCDWARGPKKKTSASAAFIGELGSGKSAAMKTAVFTVLAAGRRKGRPRSRGRAVIVDRTRRQEWVHYARACPGSLQVITVDAEAQVSLDPLRLLSRRRDGRPADASVHRRTETFVTMLLGISPMDEIADTLSEAIDAVLQRPDPSMRALLSDLDQRAGSGDTEARALARKLRRHERSDLGRTVFDPDLPVLDATADAVVFSTPNLRLPSKRELEQPELFRKLPQEAVFGRAALYLIAAICTHICFENPEEFSQAVWDECWWLTQAPEGLELLLELIRDGRKHNAGVLIGSHDPDDIGPDTPTGRILRGLIPRRHVFRQTDTTLAQRALTFLGLDPDDEDLVELVTTQLSPLHASDDEQATRAGECLARDLYGRIGTLRVLIPQDPEAAEAIHSDPESDDALDDNGDGERPEGRVLAGSGAGEGP